MRFQLVSDIHAEFHKDRGESFVASLPVAASTLVIAGDLVPLSKWTYTQTEKLFRRFTDRWDRVIYVPGNHESYDGSIAKTKVVLTKLSESISNLIWLYTGKEVVVDGTTFIGDTMWFMDSPMNFAYQKNMNDFWMVKDYLEIYQENQRFLDFLKARNWSGDEVVVTHHLPSFNSTPQKYLDSPLNRFFVCDVTSLIGFTQPKVWVHGHTHSSCDYDLWKTRVVCNPFGYPNKVNTDFIDNFVVDTGI